MELYQSSTKALHEAPYEAVIYLDWRLFGAAGRRLSALAVDLVILQPARRGFEAVERLERRIYNRAHHQTHVPTKRPRDYHFLLNLS